MSYAFCRETAQPLQRFSIILTENLPVTCKQSDMPNLSFEPHRPLCL